ncbi:MAG: winged helix-turn-helix transcriptional regulator, partial [Nanoarchaeota archaeon]|nr:winged helix-turn-helix transcriptional regulator [Nanoarchaeota archaeon]
LKFDKGLTEVKKYDSKLVSQYLNKAGIKQKVNENTLFNLGASNQDGLLNNAGFLFFTKNPKQILINAYITCARYKGIEKVNVIDRKDFEEDLVSQVEQAVEFVKRNTRLEYEIKGLYRKEIPEYPIEAVREAILNAVMHRDYFETGANVQVDIFDNRLVVTNIGALIKPLTKESLGELAIRRNPLIADLFHRIHLVEKMGTGINRIREECKKHGNVDFEIETNGFFIAKFKLKKMIANRDLEKWGESVGKTVGKTVGKILALINENPKITREELSAKTGLTIRGIEWNLAKLKEKKFLKRIGPAKGGCWKVN